jgi:hypothetical protein
METILRHTDWTESAGDQSSVRIDRQMWPLLYTWGWTGMFGPINVTCNNNTEHDSETKFYIFITKYITKL